MNTMLSTQPTQSILGDRNEILMHFVNCYPEICIFHPRLYGDESQELKAKFRTQTICIERESELFEFRKYRCYADFYDERDQEIERRFVPVMWVGSPVGYQICERNFHALLDHWLQNPVALDDGLSFYFPS